MCATSRVAHHRLQRYINEESNWRHNGFNQWTNRLLFSFSEVRNVRVSLPRVINKHDALRLAAWVKWCHCLLCEFKDYSIKTCCRYIATLPAYEWLKNVIISNRALNQTLLISYPCNKRANISFVASVQIKREFELFYRNFH